MLNKIQLEKSIIDGLKPVIALPLHDQGHSKNSPNVTLLTSGVILVMIANSVDNHWEK